MPIEAASLEVLEQKEDFIHRHIGPGEGEIAEMLSHLHADSLDALIAKAIPAKIRSKSGLKLKPSQTEYKMLEQLASIAEQNKLAKNYIGMGYYPCITPPIIRRNILQNPSWYTAYTPYQAEISQGRLEGLLNFQTMVTDLTGMDLANASLLDEGTAAAEAMTLCLGQRKKSMRDRNRFWVMDDIHPQTLEVLQTRAEPLGIEIQVGALQDFDKESMCFGAIFQYPSSSGTIHDLSDVLEKAKSQDVMTVVATDLLSLTVLKPPGEMGADIVVGSSQRFGVPLGYGGPHAAFFATRDAYKRAIPGRIVGVSVDREGRPALRLALQTREQHIRREKATSNICTSQVLLAVIAGMYAVYHGPKKLRRIASRVHKFTAALAHGLRQKGLNLRGDFFFDTLCVEADAAFQKVIREKAMAKGVNFRYLENGIGISLDETTSREDLLELLTLFGAEDVGSVEELVHSAPLGIPTALARKSPFLEHPIFNTNRSETELLRYIHSLSAKDLSLTHSMIPLGSCTMKLNATAEMEPITWPELGNIHPFAPREQTQGYAALIVSLEEMLAEITGLPGVSLQPNAGSQGEYSGLLVIRQYHLSRGDSHRNICIIPSSAHGTNPASAVMAGMQVVVVNCDSEGNIDLDDLRTKAELHAENLAALMVTYPSTHGVFEESIIDICTIIHQNGGQVYMDGANMNALVGLCKPGEFGADVLHLNLHKTFCIPHGGGGPGVGPICAAEHLKPFLPGHQLCKDAFPDSASGAVSAAPYGSAGILSISWAYIAMMGSNGLEKATKVAILNANYIAKRLSDHYPVLYKGPNGLVAHECIIDVRPLKNTAGIEVEDVAKRLIDYGFHAPTMSWPVAGTLMIEPTESESKAELDRFIDAMISIREEARAIENGTMDRTDNPLKNSPHTIDCLVKGSWDHPYSREQAVFPLPWIATHKFWPAVARIDNAYGDKNLVCSCLPMEDYA